MEKNFNGIWKNGLRCPKKTNNNWRKRLVSLGNDFQ